MMQHRFRRFLAACALSLAPFVAFAQPVPQTSTISTAGSDCTVPTNCAVFPTISLSDAPSIGVYVDVGTSGTFNFEATIDGTTWFTVADDVNAASSVTSDAARWFSNPGYRAFRVRSSAISGNAAITFIRGVTGLRSTATLSGGGGDGAIQDGVSAAIEASVVDLTNSNPVAVAIVDGSGTQITSFGGGTQYAVDAALGSTPTGTLSVAIRDDALSALTPVEGDAIGLRVDANGALWVIPSGSTTVTATDLDVQSGGADLVTSSNFTTVFGTAAIQFAEDAAHTTGDRGVPLLAVRNDAGTALAGTTGDYTPLSTDSSGALRVVGSSGTTQYAEDVAHVSGDSTVFVGSIRRDTTPSSSAGAAGDYAAINTDANGRLYTQTVLYNSSGTELTIGADVTEDAAETAGGTGPMVLSVRRDTLASSAGASGDNATFNTNSVGGLYVQPTAGVSGGADSLKRTSVGTTEDEHEVKASAGVLYSITATNTNAAVRYIRCANQVAASTTPGTTTPIIDLAVPGATTGAGITFSFPVGIGFSTGLTCWLVTGAADTDVAEVAANELKVLYSYK